MDSESPPGSARHHFGILFNALRENCPYLIDLHFYLPSRWNFSTVIGSGDFAVPDLSIDDDFLNRAGRALQGNTHVQDLRINVDSATLAGVRYISHFIASSPSISRLYIMSKRGSTQDRTSGSSAAVRTMLMAASVNCSISTLSISPFACAKHMAVCLHGMKNSLVSLELNALGLRTTMSTVEERWEEAAAMGLAVASMLALQELAISCHCDNIASRFLDHLEPVLPKLRKLMVSTHTVNHGEIHEIFIDAVQKCLLRSVKLEELYFDLKPGPDLGQNISTVPLLRTVLQQVERHPSIRIFRSNIVCGEEHIVHVVHLIENNSAVLEEIKVMCQDLPCVLQAVTALEANTVIKSFAINLYDQMVDDVIRKSRYLDKDTKRCIEYYTTRNAFTPTLAVASKVEMLKTFRRLLDTRSEAMSVIFYTLRSRDNWYE